MIKPFPRKSGKPWPWNTIPEPRPADWGVGMTVCLAAYSGTKKAFVCAVDEMVAATDITADSLAIKFAGIGGKWICMFSASDLSPVRPIIRSVQEAMQPATVPETVTEVIAAFKAAFDAEKKKKIEATVLPE
jgi:hypothetical protein